MFACLLQRARLYRVATALPLRMLFLPMSLLISTAVHAQSSLSTYADDFYQATLHKSTFQTLTTPALTGASLTMSLSLPDSDRGRGARLSLRSVPRR